MQFEDPQELSNAYLILRHLYDGDVIEWPIADDHPLRTLFAAMEAQGYLARWDRTWPLHDRYRLTDKGIATIEGVYKPAGAESLYHDLRGRKLSAAQRRAYLQQQGYDPVLWPLLHDPSTHWDMYRQDRGRYHDWFWEDQQPYRYRRGRGSSSYTDDLDVDDPDDPDVPDVHDESLQPQLPGALPYVVDLDREANTSGASDLGGGTEPASTDYDVS
jgi:hypothetical protein